MNFSAVASLAVCLLSTSACTGPEFDRPEVADEDSLLTGQEQGLEGEIAPETFVDGKGRTWTRQGVAVFEDGNDAEEEVYEEPVGPRLKMKDLPVAEIALLIRPVTLYQGYTYMVEDLDYVEAQRIKNDEPFPEIIHEGINVTEEDRQAWAEAQKQYMAEHSGLEPIEINGADDRTTIRANTAHPYNAIGVAARFGTLNNIPLNYNGGGSLVLIGLSTAISAAHVYTGASPFTWDTLSDWAYGVDRLDGSQPSQFPYGFWGGCFRVAIPYGAWAAGDGLNIEYDYAVIEYSNMYPGNCGLAPAALSTSMYWGTVATSSIQHTYGTVIGYPVGVTYSCPLMWRGTHPTTLAPCAVPFCNSASGSDTIYHWVDTTAGQSGAPYIVTVNGYPTVAGVHRGSWINNNVARRIDGTFYNFIVANSVY